MRFTTELQVSLKEPIFNSVSEIPASLQFLHIWILTKLFCVEYRKDWKALTTCNIQYIL